VSTTETEPSESESQEENINTDPASTTDEVLPEQISPEEKEAL